MAIGPFITIVSFLYSWVTAWTNLILVAGEAAAGSLNPHVLLPLTVLLLGLVMTNTLGFLEFYRDKRMKMAGIAAVDLDTPYILYTARQEILADVHNKDFANLQLRQALWRTIPLAIVGFFLAARVFLEIPLCQLAAELSRLQVSFKIQTGKDPFMQNLERDKIDWPKLHMMAGWKNRSVEDTDHPILARKGEETIVPAWANCQCSDGRWDVVDKREDVVMLFPATHENQHNRGELGGLGTGRLLAFNLVLSDELLSVLVDRGRLLQGTAAKLVTYFVGAMIGEKHGESKNLMKKFAKGAVGTAVMATSLKMQLQNVFARGSAHVVARRYVMQNRGSWNLAKLLQSTLLLLTAALPIQKRIVKERLVTSAWQKASITLHCALDLVLSTAAVIFCSLAPAAAIFGNLLQHTARQYVDLFVKERHRLETLADSLENNDPGINQAVIDLKDTMHDIFFKVGSHVYVELLESVESFSKVVGLQHYAFLLKMSFGILCFWFVSASIAKALMPKKIVLPFATYVNAGIGGPLILLSAVEEMHVRQASGKVLAMIFARVFMLTLLVGSCALSVSTFSVRAFAAIFFNQTTGIPWMLLWIGLALLHSFSGLMAVSAIEANHDLLGKKAKAQETSGQPAAQTAGPSPVKPSRTTARRPSGVPPPPRPPQRTSIVSKR